MTNTGTGQKARGSWQNRFFVSLLVFAALSSVAKDLNRLQIVGSSIQGLIGSAVHASDLPATERICPNGEQRAPRSGALGWPTPANEQVALVQPIAVNEIKGGVEAEPTVGGEIEVGASRQVMRSGSTHGNKFAAHARRMAIATNGNSAGVKPLTGVDESGTRAFRVEFDARQGNKNRTEGFEFRNVAATELDLPVGLSTRILADALNGAIPPNCALRVLGRVNRRQINVTVNGAARELPPKTPTNSVRLKHIG
jgi:hypothetical protein